MFALAFVPWTNFYMRKEKNLFIYSDAQKSRMQTAPELTAHWIKSLRLCQHPHSLTPRGAACSCRNKSCSLWNGTAASLIPQGMTPAPVSSSAASGDCVGACGLVPGRKCSRNNFQKLWIVSTVNLMVQMEPESLQFNRRNRCFVINTRSR